MLQSFSLFMLSLAKPHQYYQVCPSRLTAFTTLTFHVQILLSQGIGAGIGGGILYIPSLAIISQHFQRRRALALTIVAAGSSLGSVVHPLMLNNTLNNSSMGFAVGSRANAGLISGLLLISCLIMRTRIQTHNKSSPDVLKMLGRFVRDMPYVFMTLGCVLLLRCTRCHSSRSMSVLQYDHIRHRVLFPSVLPTNRYHSAWVGRDIRVLCGRYPFDECFLGLSVIFAFSSSF